MKDGGGIGAGLFMTRNDYNPFYAKKHSPESCGSRWPLGLNSATLFLVVVVSSFAALDMGLKNVRLKWLYPVLVSLFSYLRPFLSAKGTNKE